MDLKNPTTQKILGGLIIFLIILVTWYLTSYSKKAEEIRNLESQNEELALELEKIKLKAKSLDQLKEEAKEIYIKYKLLENLMPPQRNVPDFLDKLYSAAKECGVLINEITPEPSSPIDFYFSDPYTIQFITSYNQLGQFFSKVVNFPVVILPSNLRLEQNPVQGVGNQTVNVSAILTTYHITESNKLKPPKELGIEIDDDLTKQETIR
ncbi:type 4a pilus biogenesis protein PilO [bacterium]|nr:type 4a pilus biogenesis protein PilO [bacterium]